MLATQALIEKDGAYSYSCFWGPSCFEIFDLRMNNHASSIPPIGSDVLLYAIFLASLAGCLL